MKDFPFLSILTLLPLIGAVVVALIPRAKSELAKTVDGVRVRLALDPAGTTARTNNVWTFALTDASGAYVSLEPYLGAMGHLVLVNEDGSTYVHSHPDERGESATGRVSFLVRPPKPGLYRAWAQFQRDGRVLTSDFVVAVR